MPAMKMTRLLPLALLALLLAACNSMPSKKVDTIGDYGAAVRWSEWERAWAYVDPAIRGGLSQRQVVEIRYIEQATQRELTARDEQAWRTDDEGKHWWLTSGLPQF